MNTIVFFLLVAFMAVASAQLIAPGLARTSIVGPSGIITRDEGLGLAAPLTYGHGLATPFLGRGFFGGFGGYGYGHGGLLY